MSSNPCLDAALAELAAVGIHHPQIVQGGKHLQLRWTSPITGQLRVVGVSRTPSHQQAPAQAAAEVRRVLRGDGMLSRPEPKASPPRQPSRLELLERRLARIEQKLGITKEAV